MPRTETRGDQKDGLDLRTPSKFRTQLRTPLLSRSPGSAAAHPIPRNRTKSTLVRRTINGKNQSTPTGRAIGARHPMNSVKKAIKLAFSRVGLDIRRADRPGGELPIIDYPIDPRPRWGHGRKPHSTIEHQLTLQLNDFKKLLADFGKYKSAFSRIPFDSASPIAPVWNNGWFSTLDAASLVYFIAERAPKTHVEIGSGFSTKFARAAISAANLSTKLISIDPNPRAEIDRICDDIIRKPLEDLDLSIFDTL